MFQPQPTPFASYHLPPSSSSPLLNFLPCHGSAPASSASSARATCTTNNNPAASHLTPTNQRFSGHQSPTPAANPDAGLYPEFGREFPTASDLEGLQQRHPSIGSGGRTANGKSAHAGASPVQHSSLWSLQRHMLSSVQSAQPDLTRPSSQQALEQHLSQPQHHFHDHLALRNTRHAHHLSAHSGTKMEDQDPHGVAAQQAAAKDYRPDLPNYLVGDKQPSTAITEEYAKADATYVEKTIALPDQYSHYRPIQGDGNCGWRAIGFAYFEKLIDAGTAQIESECNRLVGMNSMLTGIGGYAFELFEDWADDFISCLRELGHHAGTPMAHALLLQKWNDGPTTAGYIYYMRLLAATYLKANADTYDPFIADSGGVHGYCQHSIEMVNREIEHLGITALVNVLLKPVNMVLEIAYLDRSPGSQVNKYRLPEEANNVSESSLGPIIYLLYRPDHYDILYREAQPASIQVHRVNGVSDNARITSIHEDPTAFTGMDLTSLVMIPGFTDNMPLRPSNLGHQGSLPQHDPWAQAYSMPVSTPTPPMAATPSNPSLSPHSSLGPSRPPPPPSDAASGIMNNAPECTIRFSALQYQYDGGNSAPMEPFQVTTSTFKNSVWNRAHFGNPDFHPEEWSPEDENIDGRVGVAKRRGSKRD